MHSFPDIINWMKRRRKDRHWHSKTFIESSVTRNKFNFLFDLNRKRIFRVWSSFVFELNRTGIKFLFDLSHRSLQKFWGHCHLLDFAPRQNSILKWRMMEAISLNVFKESFEVMVSLKHHQFFLNITVWNVLSRNLHESLKTFENVENLVWSKNISGLKTHKNLDFSLHCV